MVDGKHWVRTRANANALINLPSFVGPRRVTLSRLNEKFTRLQQWVILTDTFESPTLLVLVKEKSSVTLLRI